MQQYILRLHVKVYLDSDSDFTTTTTVSVDPALASLASAVFNVAPTRLAQAALNALGAGPPPRHRQEVDRPIVNLMQSIVEKVGRDTLQAGRSLSRSVQIIILCALVHELRSNPDNYDERTLFERVVSAYHGITDFGRSAYAARKWCEE